jgi:hypothetical protein
MMRFLMIVLFLSIPFFLLTECSSTTRLTSAEKSKLDPSLQKLLETGEGDPDHYDVHTRSDGTRVYGVIIRSQNVDALRKAGIKIGSIFGDVVTAQITVKEIRKIADIPSVRSISNSSKNYPLNHK